MYTCIDFFYYIYIYIYIYLGTVERKLKGGEYASARDFLADLRRVFDNAMLYPSSLSVSVSLFLSLSSTISLSLCFSLAVLCSPTPSHPLSRPPLPATDH